MNFNVNYLLTEEMNCVYQLSIQVMKTSSFDYNDEAVNRFLNAPLVTLPEALGSPPNSRLTVSGHVIDVSKIFSLYITSNGNISNLRVS